MQHYMNFGLGFSADALTPEEFSRLVDFYNKELTPGKVGLSVVSFTEGDPEISWATVVILNLGKAGKAGKLVSASDMRGPFIDLLAKQEELRAEIIAELAKHDLAHLEVEIEPILYSDNY